MLCFSVDDVSRLLCQTEKLRGPRNFLARFVGSLLSFPTSTSCSVANAMSQIHLDSLTEEQQKAFVRGWKRAGGYVGDSESPSPWCCPWLSGESVVLQSCSENPEDWGAQYWEEVKNEVRAIRAEKEVDRIAYVEENALGELENELECQLYRFRDAPDWEPAKPNCRSGAGVGRHAPRWRRS